MIKPTRFYIYQHSRNDNGNVFYIGKGTWTPKKSYGRAYSAKNRNAIWQRIVEKNNGEFNVTVLAEFLNEIDAFQYEAELIKLYGRRDRGGILANLTDGGEGAIGREAKETSILKWKSTMVGRTHIHAGKGCMLGKKHTEETKKAISLALSGSKNPMFGKTHSLEIKEKMSIAVRKNHARSRPVIDIKTGNKFASGREAARMLDLNPNTLKAWLSGKSSNQSTLRYL